MAANIVQFANLYMNEEETKSLQSDIDWYSVMAKKEEILHDFISREWIATKRAMQAERNVIKLRKQLIDNGIEPVV